MRIAAAAIPALRHEVVDAAPALAVAGIPVLHGRIFDLGVIERNELHDRRMKLVLVALGRRAAFEIAHVRAFVRDDERALELPGLLLVDAKVSRQLHRAAHALRHIDEGAVRKDRAVQGREEIIRHRHDRTQIFLHEFGMRLHRFRNRAEDHAGLRQLLLEGRGDRHAVEHGVDRHPAGFDAREDFLLTQRNAELLVSAQQLGIDFVERLRPRRRFRRGIVIEILIVDRRIMHPRPFGLRHGQPAAIGLEAPLREPFGLVLFRGNESDDVFAEALGSLFRLNIGRKPVLVSVDVDRLDARNGLLASRHLFSPRHGGFKARRPIPSAVRRRNGATACGRRPY